MLNWQYVFSELNKLGIAGFEAKNRSLALNLFEGKTLTAPDHEMLEYILSSGTYGTIQNWVKTRITKYGNGLMGKMRYLFHRLFLPMRVIQSISPLFVKCPILLPFFPLYRVIQALTVRRKRMIAELKALRK